MTITTGDVRAWRTRTPFHRWPGITRRTSTMANTATGSRYRLLTVEFQDGYRAQFVRREPNPITGARESRYHPMPIMEWYMVHGPTTGLDYGRKLEFLISTGPIATSPVVSIEHYDEPSSSIEIR